MDLEHRPRALGASTAMKIAELDPNQGVEELLGTLLGLLNGLLER